jgi:hypothetical protein
MTSKTNCGFCAQICGGNLVCTQGQCACPTGMTDCAGLCVSLQTDLDNCGACGTTCASACVAGHCQ